MFLRVKFPKKHFQVLSGIEILEKLFSNLSWLDGKTVAFTRDVIE